MLSMVVWVALLTSALLAYPRRPLAAGVLIALMGIWTFVLRYLPWNIQRLTTGYWTAWWMAAFWLAWGLVWIVRFSNARRRAAHIAYWTAKAD
jgi:hypothetical protein